MFTYYLFSVVLLLFSVSRKTLLSTVLRVYSTFARSLCTRTLFDWAYTTQLRLLLSLQ